MMGLKKHDFQIVLFLFLNSKEDVTMPEVILSDYFYGDESEQFSYYRLPGY